MTPVEMRIAVRDVLRGLKAVKDGHVFEPHKVRYLLAEARDLERKLEKWHMAMWNMRRSAEIQFCEGWPKATKAPWCVD